MKKSVVSLFLLFFVIFSISAHSVPSPPQQYTDDTFNLTLDEKYYDQFYPNDRHYEIDLYMEDWSSFQNRTVSIRLNLHLDTSDSCFYSGFFTAVDASDNWIDETIDGEADAGWTDWLEVYISLDVDKIDFDISHYCYDEIPGWFEIEILVEGEPATTTSPIIDFWTDDQTILKGSCTNIFWDVTYASDVYFEDTWVSDAGSRNVCPQVTTDYVLDVLGEDGKWYSRTLTIYVEKEPQVSPEPYINFYADDYDLEYGHCTEIYWQVSDAIDVYFDGEPVSHYSSTVVCPEETTEFVLEVLGEDGVWYTESVLLYVEENIVLPVVYYWGDDYDLSFGDCTTVHWDVLNASEVKFGGSFVRDSAEKDVCPNATTEYLLEVLGEDGIWYHYVLTIYVEELLIPSPVITLYADAYNIFRGNCATIFWEVTDASEVYFDGESVGNFDNFVACPETSSDFLLEVLGVDGSWYSQTVTIEVNEPPILEPEIKFRAEDDSITDGECTTLYWDVVNADEVLIDGEKKGFSGSQEVCPKSSTDYRLEAYWQDGKGMSYSTVSITVEELSCRGKGGFILIVTDSELLNRSTGNSNTWKDVKQALEDYYDSSAYKCTGKALFLDIAQVKRDFYPSYKFIDQQIEDFMKDMRVEFPAALAIIGGPNVIPHEPPAELDPFHGLSDDSYADFDHDRQHSPDTVITRLPDGGSKDVLINYLNALQGGRTPSGGALLVTDIKTSAHNLNFTHRSVSITSTGIYNGERYLEDYIELQIPGEVTHLITPPQVSQYRKYGTDYEVLIRLDDLVNADPATASKKYSSLAASGVREQLDHRLVVFGDFAISNGLGYYLSNVISQDISPTLYSPFNYVDANYFSEGAQVFSLVGKGALLDDPSGEGRLIPISALTAGVHHFIGRTDHLPVFSNEKFRYDGQSFWDMDITQSAGKFAAEYFRILCDDPATSFWEAKQVLYSVKDLSAKYFLYFGLPEHNEESFGIYKPISRIKHPEPSAISLPPHPTGCPSGDFDDCDGDQLSDELEYRLASTFAPYLIPDEDEDQLPIYHSEGENPFGVFWQVSPAKLDGREGAWITYVFTYTSDGGAHDFDIDFPDCAKCFAGSVVDWCECDPWPPWTKKAACCLKIIAAPVTVPIAVKYTGVACTAEEILIDQLSDFGINYNVNQWLSFHPGDNEAFRVFVAKNNGIWSLTHINWKRHHEGFDYEGHLQTLSEAKADGLEFFEHSHPLLYVSEDKHAMYPTDEYCEGYEMKIKEHCKISFEHCSGHKIYNYDYPIRTLILEDLNVGEADAHLFEDMGPVFPGENVWAKGDKDYFCGSLWNNSPGFAEPGPCGGPMGKLWYVPGWSIDF